MRLSRSNVVNFGLSALSALLMWSCNSDTPRQSADLLFTDGKFPALLENIANPKPDAESLKNQAKPALRVGVIDEGVDYLHPQLVSRIAFSRDADNKIIGAGYDVLGKDNWAYPTIIDASYMGFGAELTSDKFKIVKALPDPLKTLTELNAHFIKLLQDKIHADSKLSNTIFASKVDAHAFHLLGVMNLIEPSEVKVLLGLYQDHKKAKALIKDGKISANLVKFQTNLSRSKAEEVLRQRAKPKSDQDPIAAKSSKITVSDSVTETLDELQETIDAPWIARKGSGGIPFGVGLMVFHEGFDEFMTVIDQAYHEFDTEVGFENKYLKPFVDFVLADTPSDDTEKDPRKRLLTRSDDLFDQSLDVESNYADADSLERTRAKICKFLKDQKQPEFSSAQTGEAKKEILHQSLVNATKDLHDILNFANASSQVDLLSKVGTRKNSKSISTYAKFDDTYVKDRDFTKFVCDQPMQVFSDSDTPAYQSFKARYSNPYQSVKDTHSHGTHVSGIIVSQHPNIGIVPVRVMNQAPRTSEAEDKAATENLVRDLEAWVKDPVALAATAVTLKDYLPEADAKLSPADQQAITLKAINQIIEEQIPMNYRDGDNAVRVDDIFFRQVREAVRYVGSQKLKVVNISMGTESSRPLSPEVKDSDVEIAELMRFLVFEYFKTSVAHDIKTYAPNTLFVIAAGNSTAPVDGESKSALPCDLSSPLLARAAKNLGLPVPETNQIDNILCVGSINRDGVISSFSNDVLSKTPFVLSFGEAIPSSIATGDCHGVDQRVRETLGAAPGSGLALGKNSEDVKKAYLIANGKLKADATDADIRNAIEKLDEQLDSELGVIGALSDAATKHQCVTGKDPHFIAKYSGTSMATPAVSGYVGRFLIDKMAKDGLTEEEAFALPAYSPHQIIADIFASAEKKGGDSLLKDTPMLRNIYGFGEQPRTLPATGGMSYLQDTNTPAPQFVMSMGQK